MRTIHLFVFIAALALCALPRTAAAQSSCWYAYCDSYLYYDSFSNEVFGYSRSSDYLGVYMIAAEAQLDGPSGMVDADSTDWWWFEATAYVHHTPAPSQYGAYFLNGYHYFGTWDYYVYWYDGSTHAEANASEPPNPPYISSVTVGGDPVRGGSGLATVAGWDLVKCSGGSSVSIGGGISASITSADCNNQSQVMISYTIPINTKTGTQELALTTPFGTASWDFDVYDPPPSIANISTPWEAGGVYEFGISGSGFGSNPSISITDAGVGAYGITSSSDTYITAWVDLTYATQGEATVSVTSNGFGGNNWAPAPGGSSSGQTSAKAQVAAPPAACPVPGSEESTAGNWCDTCVGGTFTAALKDAGGATPQNGKYQGRKVRERLSDLVDTCKFEGAGYRAVLPPEETLKDWDVGSINTYGSDLIGVSQDYAIYFQGEVRNGRYESCYVSVQQTMQINSCGGSPTWTSYATHDTRNTITASGMDAKRANATKSGAIAPKAP